MLRAAGALLLGVLLAGACSSSSSSRPGAAATSSTVPATVSPAASSAELAARLVTTLPSGFVRQPDAKYDTGPSDLAKAVRDDGQKGAEARLRGEGFVRGYQRLWLGPGQVQIIVFVYQFATPAGARTDYARDTSDFNSTPPPGAHKFAPAGVARPAVGVAQSDKTGGAATVFFTTGVYVVQIATNGPHVAGAKLTELQAVATSIARDQGDRLSGRATR